MEKIYKLETIVFYGCLIFLVILCALGFIAYPAVDDYEYALKSIEKGFWKLMRDKKVCSFAGVPYFYEVLNKIKFDKIDLPHLKYFTQAGGALRKDLIEYFLTYSEKNKKEFENYWNNFTAIMNRALQ